MTDGMAASRIFFTGDVTSVDRRQQFAGKEATDKC
jgi:hypothetical protein